MLEVGKYVGEGEVHVCLEVWLLQAFHAKGRRCPASVNCDLSVPILKKQALLVLPFPLLTARREAPSPSEMGSCARNTLSARMLSRASSSKPPRLLPPTFSANHSASLPISVGTVPLS